MKAGDFVLQSAAAEFSYLADPVFLSLATLFRHKGCICPKGQTLATCQDLPLGLFLLA